MKFPSRILQVCIALIATSLVAQRETFVPANDVQFTISTDRTHFRARERITVKYRIVNISNGSLYVPRAWEAKCPPSPHIWAWFEDSAGKHFMGGWGGSCPGGITQTIAERMSKEAVLLQPGEHVDGSVNVDPIMFSLPPGGYRIEAVLWGWRDNEFNDKEQAELKKFGSPFLRGEAPASLRISLTP